MHLVECTEVPKEGTKIIKDLGRWGRYVFEPQDDYDGRCIVTVPTLQHQQQLLEANPPGRRIFVVPQDILDVQTRELIEEVVVEVLERYGLKPKEELVEGLGAPDRRRRGRPKKG